MAGHGVAWPELQRENIMQHTREECSTPTRSAEAGWDLGHRIISPGNTQDT